MRTKYSGSTSSTHLSPSAAACYDHPMTEPLPNPIPRRACPTLAAPMLVADGLLVRFRPAGPLNREQIAALARASARFGNGRVEVTARGSIQVRGLSGETEGGFRAALDAAGIAARTGVVIEYSPIAGDDPAEIRDPLPLAHAIEAVCHEALARGPLSPKLSVVLDSGGQISLAGLKADILLRAAPDGWEMEVGAVLTGTFAEGFVPGAVADVLRRLQAIGPRARGGDLALKPESAPSLLRFSGERRIPSIDAGDGGDHAIGPGFRRDSEGSERGSDRRGPEIDGASRAYPVNLRLKDGSTAMRIGLPYGQVRVEQLSELARFIEAHGVAEVRPGPERTLVLVGADEFLSPALDSLGFGPSALTLCSGAEASENGLIHASDVARAFAAAAPELTDGSVHLHVSTCAKGCAYTGRAGIVLDGDRLTLYRGASQKPFARLDPAAIEAGLVSLAARIRDTRQPGETTLAAIERLGA